MAVKVRCPTCEKVLSAPDTARGKAVKCPGCETKVKVPAEESSGRGSSTTRRSGAKAPARKRGEEDSIEFLAGLDLDKAVDTSAQMCPKCGANIPEEATECPKCGVDPTT
ncbi:MAG: zinc ribbon domain-containing protein, partial [Deltaproteobacteria bacterium]